MPVTSRKRKAQHSNPSLDRASRSKRTKVCESAFLLLPLEIRLRIYVYCFTPPFPTKTISKSSRLAHSPRYTKTRSIITKPRERIFFEQSKCILPLTHQSLLFVCRLLHADIWPFYAACHSFGFNQPLKFANDILSYLPLQRLSAIRHLSLYVDEDSRDYSPASRNGINRLANDLHAVFDHYSDVFDNLQSFKVQIGSVRHYWPEIYSQKDIMHNLLLNRLKDQYDKEEIQIRNGDVDVTKTPFGQDIKPNKWRLGMVSRFRRVKLNRVEVGHDASFMVFFERLPPAFDRARTPAFGTAHINFASWFEDELQVPAAVGMRGADSIITPDLTSISYTPDSRVETVFWPMHRLDTIFKSDMLHYALLIDIGCRRTQCER